MITERTTKYKQEALAALERLGHATNQEIAREVRSLYPTVSDTTIHRVTARLLDAGHISIAPPATDGSMRYDINLKEHDHFYCEACGGIRDIYVAEQLIPTVQDALGGCRITGRLTIHGSCDRCLGDSND